MSRRVSFRYPRKGSSYCRAPCHPRPHLRLDDRQQCLTLSSNSVGLLVIKLSIFSVLTIPGYRDTTATFSSSSSEGDDEHPVVNRYILYLVNYLISSKMKCMCDKCVTRSPKQVSWCGFSVQGRANSKQQKKKRRNLAIDMYQSARASRTNMHMPVYMHYSRQGEAASAQRKQT